MMLDLTYFYCLYFLFLINLLCPMQKFSFQDMENSRIKIVVDHTIADTEDLDHEDKLSKNTRAASAAGKASSSRHPTQDRSEDDSDEEILMYYDPMPLAYAFPIPSSAIPDDVIVDAAPLNQGPPSTGGHAGQKRGVKPQPEPVQQTKR
jgi:hypothetical protein